MCGRYSIAVEASDVEKHFRATFTEPIKPRYNAAPSQKLPVILNFNPRKIVLSSWGLKPAWLSKISKRDGLINVRAETLKEKHTFQSDLAERRCLIPADGFYEWKALPNGKKTPYRIVRKDGQLFAFAGIWEEDKNDGKFEPRFAIITTEANEIMKPIHWRMPVILETRQEALWLGAKVPISELLNMLGSAPSQDLRAYEVSPIVNRGTIDTSEIIKPVE